MKRIGSSSEERIGLFSLKSRGINKGEEITYSYGKGEKNMYWRKCKTFPNGYSYQRNIDLPIVKNSENMCTYCDKIIDLPTNDAFYCTNTSPTVKMVDLPTHDVTQEMEQATSSNEIYICKYCLYIEKLMIRWANENID